MKIGLFGDSYIDIVWHRWPTYQVPPEKKIWAQRLLEELGASVITSGLGGSNQYYAITQWNEAQARGVEFDYAFFTFTWDNRLYIDDPKWQKILSAHAENREIYEEDRHLFQPGEAEKCIQALGLYYEVLHNQAQAQFNYEQMVRWCLDLPAKFPNTRFIFLPNTELSREIAKRHFSQGVLLDFAFETISAHEGDLIGVTPYQMDRVGHMSSGYHEIFKDIAKDLVSNYENYKNQIVPFDYGRFGITNV